LRIIGQRLGDGSVEIFDAPSPLLPEGWVRVRTLFSAISPGTEGGKILAGRMNLLEKARAKPEQVAQVARMVGTMGLRDTMRKVRSRLEGAQPLGYSLSGRVLETGGPVEGIEPGMVVACAGGGYANHADEAVVPANLCAVVPDGVAPDRAAFATLGAIALQGVRLAEPQAGDRAVVIGLGIIGALASQILRASGCGVMGVDTSKQALELAASSGSVDAAVEADGPVEARCSAFTRGRGADIVLICAGSSDSSTVSLAGRLARKRGRLVVVGAVGMDLPREDYYRKELAFTVSCSYGPGRYDPSYEEGGADYPYPFVRWTEGRNLEAVLDLMAAGSVDPSRITTHRIPFEEAASAYSMIASRSEPFCGVLLRYGEGGWSPTREVPLASPPRRPGRESTGIAFLGSGSFAQAFILPSLSRDRSVRLTSICTRGGLTASDLGRRHRFERAVSSLDDILSDDSTGAVVIAARHDLHGPAVIRCLQAGRSVFVEKPLCLDREQLAAISALQGPGRILQVGFNRRFSRAASLVRRHFGEGHGPLSMVYRVSAGRIAADHWIQDPVQGGGRIVGEACHFIDLMQYIAGAPPVEVSATAVSSPDRSLPAQDNCSVLIRFADGSTGVLCYLSEGSAALPKERLEVHGEGRSAVLDNFRKVELYGRTRISIPAPGKGYAEEMRAFTRSLGTGTPAIDPGSSVSTTLATFCILDSLAGAGRVPVDPSALRGPACP
jgi:predicted dehydrogenase/threonine dehydrogenase-like Zn-dependent dehydrogenase